MVSCLGCWFPLAAGRDGRCSPRLRCSGSRLLSKKCALHCARFQPSGVPQKHGLGCACVLCLPRPSGSGSQELDGRTLPGCGAPSPLCGPSPSLRPSQSGACALCLVGTLPADVDHPESQKVLIRNWRPVCSAVGAAVLGAKPAPFPSPLPPASSGGWAGPQPASSSLELLSPFVLKTAGSVSGPVNSLCLLLSYSLSCYLTLAPSNCPQGIRAGPYPEQCRRSSPFRPRLLVVDAGRLGYFSAGSCF